jgi:DNA-directed RNA polymerase specialized sigma24 family protein
MALEQYLPRLRGYAIFLSKDNADDLVQDTLVSYLQNKDNYKLSEALLNTICKNKWKDSIKKLQMDLLDEDSLIEYPEVEVLIYCKEANINLYEWTTIDLKKIKDAERKRKEYWRKKQCSLQ